MLPGPAAKRHTYERALREHDARNAQALRLAHVPAGKGVGADRRRAYGIYRLLGRAGSCTPGETTKWLPHQYQKKFFLLSPKQYYFDTR
jgi:hypothetical protein